jgi:hypothetical protein
MSDPHAEISTAGVIIADKTEIASGKLLIPVKDNWSRFRLPEGGEGWRGVSDTIISPGQIFGSSGSIDRKPTELGGERDGSPENGDREYVFKDSSR